MDTNELTGIFRLFVPEEFPISIITIDTGNINLTWKIRSNAHKEYICQKISKKVFGDYSENISENYGYYLEAFKSIEKLPFKWEVPQWLKAGEGYLYRDENNCFWRVYPLIKGHTYSHPENLNIVRNFAKGISKLHYILNNNKVIPKTTIPNFHSLKHYHREYLNVKSNVKRDSFCDDVIEKYVDKIFDINTIKDKSMIHGDTKLSNAIFNSEGEMISIIDLDTFSYGSRLIDIADSVRSVATFQPNFASAFLDAYLNSTYCLLTEEEKEHLGDALLYIPFELGLRYYTDYLMGNVYFTVKNTGDNLYKAIRQFEILKLMQAPDLR